MDVMEVLGIAGLIISVPATVGLSLAIIKSSYNSARLEDADKENARLHVRLVDAEKIRDQYQVENEYLKEKNDILREMVTQRAELEAHRTMVARNHKLILEKLDRLLTAVDKVINYVRKS